MRPIRVGVVGLGAVAAAHIDTFSRVAGAEVVAVCSRRRHDPEELERRYGRPLRVFRCVEDMLAARVVDVVDICTPHPLHAEAAIAAARAGKHVMIEKPVALDIADTLRIRDAVSAAGVRSCVGFECRFSMHFSLVRSLIDKGLLGRVHLAEVDYFHGIGPDVAQFGWNVRKDWGGSSLLTAGCHALDALLYFMGGAVEEVVSFSTRTSAPEFAPYEYDTTSASLLRFADGRIGKVTSSIDALQPYHLRVHLVGSDGAVDDRKFWTRKLPGLKKDEWSTFSTSLVESGDVREHPYLPQFQEFIAAIREDREMERTSLAAAIETHRVIFAADLAAREQRTVKLKEIPGAASRAHPRAMQSRARAASPTRSVARRKRRS